MTPKKNLETVPPAAPGIAAPLGPLVNAAWIIRHYHTDPDTGEQLVTERWVRQNVPGKVRPSYNVVGWFRHSVVQLSLRSRACGQLRRPRLVGGARRRQTPRSTVAEL